MSLIDESFLRGFASCLHDNGICKVANSQHVAMLSHRLLEKRAEDPTGANQPTPEQLGQVAEAGITEGDIQSAAKVVQIIADMKQQSDSAAAGQAPGQPAPAQPANPAPPQGAGGQQPPMPPAPSGGGQPAGQPGMQSPPGAAQQ